MEIDYTRKITHTGYHNPELVRKYFHRVPKNIYQEIKHYDRSFQSVYLLCNDEFIVGKTKNVKWVPIIMSIIPFLLVAVLFKNVWNGTSEYEYIFVFFLFLLLGLFFVFYGLTMPKTEAILNRRDGLITFDGFLWQDNITMPFSEVEFCYSTGGEDLQGAFQLQIMRPNKWVTFAISIALGRDCYKEMSFITWYMDKNRPLPPGELFDPYREADFQRRKAEGFPKPLYPSDIPTPEATPEQQAERERIGGW